MAASGADLWDGVVGQAAALARLRVAAADPVHAYLFIGPPGCTKFAAARAFAALLLDPSGDPEHRDVRLALAGEHPDVREVRRVGAAISSDQADEIVRAAAMAPSERARKVLILDEFHLLRAEGAAKLLKTVEEPPASTVFVILADHLPMELVTIGSRCARVDFRTIPDDVVAGRLEREGIAPGVAAQAAVAAGGDLDKARLFATDDGLATRRRAFAALPRRLDGTGATVVDSVDELQALIDAAAAPLTERHEREIAELEADVAASGERGGGRAALAERHKREVRRHRVDELKSGLATVASSYRDALVAGEGRRPDAHVEAVGRLHRAIEALDRSPNETLLLQSLLLQLPGLAATPPASLA